MKHFSNQTVAVILTSSHQVDTLGSYHDTYTSEAAIIDENDCRLSCGYLKKNITVKEYLLKSDFFKDQGAIKLMDIKEPFDELASVTYFKEKP